MSATTMSTATMSTAGERFATALAAQDHTALRATLTDNVDFAALTPGRAWLSTDAAEIVDDIVLGTWFGPGRRVVELCSVTNGDVADCSHVGYQLRVERDGVDYLVAQHAFYTEHDDRIDWIRIVCSGYRKATDTPSDQSDDPRG